MFFFLIKKMRQTQTEKTNYTTRVNKPLIYQ